MGYGPFCTNAFVIVFVGKAFAKTSKWLVDRENHQFKQAFENSLIQKQYLFMFINANISCWIFAFLDRNFNGLQKNLIIILAFKQLIMNLWEWISDKWSIGMEISKVEKLFRKKLNAADFSNDKLKICDANMHF